MGRKKKQFIDKKNAVTFNLVHRSQKDPLIDDIEESQMVLATQATPMSHDDHLTEQQKNRHLFIMLLWKPKQRGI